MEIRCKNCGSVVPASNIDLKGQIAKCDRCNSVFNCRDLLSGVSGNRAEIRLPDRIRVRRDISGLNIERSWFSSRIIFLTFFTVFWDGFMIFWYGESFRTGNYTMGLFGSLHALIGLFLTYSVMTGFINKTRITVIPQLLTIRHGPIPAPGNITINPAEIKQVYSMERVSHGKHGPNYSYEMRAATRSGKDIKLLKGLENKEQVLYIEQEIERYLRIKDEPVAGEIPR